MTSDSALRIARHCDDLPVPPHSSKRAHHRGRDARDVHRDDAPERRRRRAPRRDVSRLLSRVRRATKTGGEAIGIARRAPARAARLSVRASDETAEEITSTSLVDRATTYTADLREMGMTMPIIRRNVAGPKNDLKALKVFQDALDGVLPENEDEVTRLEKVLDQLNDLRLDKAEEELFWAEREGQVVSPIVDNAQGLSDQEKSEVGNMVANITMYGVQGAVWNAMILLVVFVSIVNFLR